LKDEQGYNVINEETIKIIRNLRQKAVFEKLDREHYINQMLTDLVLKIHTQKLSPMSLIEKYGQEWCLVNGIIGYDYICSVSVNPQKRS